MKASIIIIITPYCLRRIFVMETSVLKNSVILYISFSVFVEKWFSFQFSDTHKTISDRGHLDQTTLDYLMVNNPRLGRFYLLPKIHKRLNSVPGRPVISNCGFLRKTFRHFWTTICNR